MAGQSHLDMLKKGIKAWNEWRIQNPSTVPDLTGANLQRAFLQGADLQRAGLQRADLQGADLRRAYLREANLQGANLGEADLRGAYLRGADLRRAYFGEANLQEADLQGANLEDVERLTQTQIERAVGDETTTLPRKSSLQRPEGWRSRARAGNLRGAANDTVLETTEDQLGFVHYVNAFAQLIDSPDTVPPLTIGIYGSWGMGKSFLLKNIEWKLGNEEFKNRPQPGTARRPEVHVVSFNAWEYSAAEVIWPGLVRKIMDKMEETWSGRRSFFATKFWRNARRQTRQFRGRLLLVALVLAVVFLVALMQSGNGATTFADGVIAVGGAFAVLTVGGLIKLVTDTLANPLGQYVTALAEDSDYGKHIGYMTEIREDIKKLEEQLRDENGRILVVVDDLDRCEPQKAVEVLQAINLLLNFESFIVCLGIDARIITAAVDKYYEGMLGDVGASGYEYLEKIVQIPFRIPQPSEEEIKVFISKQMRDPKPSGYSRQEGGPNGTAGPEPPSEEGRSSSEALQTGTQTETHEDAPIHFTHDELKGFQNLAPFLRRNPRHLKRLVNVYRLVRDLAASKEERAIRDKPAATIRWLVICAQWPYTSHAMLWQYAEKLEEWEGRIPAAPPAGDPLLYLLNQISPHLARDKQHKLDDDPESLRRLLERKGERFTWEELRRIRQYTVNFNPVVEIEMWAPLEEGQLVDSTGAGRSDTRTSQA
jgi:Cdc6-like AAA superfamily ATPase